MRLEKRSPSPRPSSSGAEHVHIFFAGHRRHDRVPHPPGGTPKPRNGLEGIARESGCVLGGKGGHQVPLSRRDILRIARRLNAGKHRAWHTSPEGTAEGWAVGSDLSRPFGTRALSAWVMTSPRRGGSMHPANTEHGSAEPPQLRRRTSDVERWTFSTAALPRCEISA